jgi:hypothetical protein
MSPQPSPRGRGSNSVEEKEQQRSFSRGEKDRMRGVASPSKLDGVALLTKRKIDGGFCVDEGGIENRNVKIALPG